jgi:polysaccharide pyruvyl transferase WcaK-like protein
MPAPELGSLRGLFSRPLREFLRSPMPEATIFDHMVAAVEERLARLPQNRPATWPRDRTLKMLLVGYSGNRNIGADVRVAEMVRQMRHLFGPERIDCEMLMIGNNGLAEQAPGVATIKAEGYLPEMLADRIGAADGIVACEGSMFKSNFSSMLALLLTGGLALASAEQKLAVAWGAEAGSMDDRLTAFVERYCKGALVIARNPPSERRLAALGLRTFLGADSAWTYRPASPVRAEEVLRSAGWDGRSPVTCVCPVNPFWYPVRPDLARARELAETGAHSEDHFGSVLFHERSPETASKYHQYLDQVASALRDHAGRSHPFVVIVGMEMLDRQACEDLAARLPGKVPVLLSGDLPAADVAAVLRRCDLLLSSRYHAILLATPGLVPVVGIPADERIPNLLGELGHPGLGVPADAPDLSGRLLEAITAATSGIDDLREAQGRLVAAQVRRIGLACQRLAVEVSHACPGFHEPDTGPGWDRFIPPVDPVVGGLLERYA